MRKYVRMNRIQEQSEIREDEGALSSEIKSPFVNGRAVFGSACKRPCCVTRGDPGFLLPPPVEAIVEFDYKAQHDDELTITVGDIITNIKKDDGGWWEGETNGKRGLFPDNFVRLLGGCMVSPQCEKKQSADGTRFRGQRVFVFALPSQRRGGSGELRLKKIIGHSKLGENNKNN
ncbi:UNVERIFIED_CONTAM: hypothetical protein FKN15_063579 [Acipenser sinensis]